uniref:V-type proton ATPase subunit C n=2 Tax=Aegilops tauschii subsp. strangulata TaxID=200361 RepID=A0A452XCE1_AEGTS
VRPGSHLGGVPARGERGRRRRPAGHRPLLRRRDRGAHFPLRAQFTVPDLRPGRLDSLLALSDDLVKSNIFIEGISHKIRRQIEDLECAGGVEPGTLTVDGVPVDSYLTRFVWDEGKYPVNAPLKETVASIQSQVTKIEDDMKSFVPFSGTD